jgi:hypothetical protein
LVGGGAACHHFTGAAGVADVEGATEAAAACSAA